ncbi:MAG: hypothetical protein CMH55_10045 [Myxococcales bacterium]|nr:hypothetical protein [Myxococcales bacterium]
MLARLLKEGKPIRFFAQGRSMWPWIKAGDLVRIVPIDGPLRRGDVVLIERSPGDLLLHRLMEHQEGQLRLQGDHRNEDDGWFDRSQAIGKLAAIERNGRAIRISRFRALLLSRMTRRADRLISRLRSGPRARR